MRHEQRSLAVLLGFLCAVMGSTRDDLVAMRRTLGAGLVLAFSCTGVLCGAPRENEYVRLPISEATDLFFTSVAFGQGPAHSRVSHIVEDNAGFLWFGTKDGLKRYDGYRFRDFRPNLRNRTSLSGVFINALFKDHSGKLWVAPDENLDRYDPSTEEFTHYASIPGRFEPRHRSPVERLLTAQKLSSHW
jgi:hypothetical protein